MADFRQEPQMVLIERIQLLAADLSIDTVDHVARILEATPAGDWTAIRHRLDAAVSSARYRLATHDLVNTWQSLLPSAAPSGVALALRAVAREQQMTRRDQGVELVWTGPKSEVVPLRRTDQALLQVIECASTRLLIVAFAIYRIPHVRDALAEAVHRGVQVRVVVEAATESGGKTEIDGVRALGSEVQDFAEIYTWPRTQRRVDTRGHHGSLHVKCAVADDIRLFVSSANLTEYAHTINMELGILIHGGLLPQRVWMHFDRFIATGVLAKIAPSN